MYRNARAASLCARRPACPPRRQQRAKWASIVRSFSAARHAATSGLGQIRADAAQERSPLRPARALRDVVPQDRIAQRVERRFDPRAISSAPRTLSGSDEEGALPHDPLHERLEISRRRDRPRLHGGLASHAEVRESARRKRRVGELQEASSPDHPAASEDANRAASSGSARRCRGAGERDTPSARTAYVSGSISIFGSASFPLHVPLADVPAVSRHADHLREAEGAHVSLLERAPRHERHASSTRALGRAP